MGLSHFPSASEGVLPVLVMNTVLSVSLLKNMVRSMLSAMSSTESLSNLEEDLDDSPEDSSRERRISITPFNSLCNTRTAEAINSSSNATSSRSGTAGWTNTGECCVCLCGFEADDEVSELSCKHFFHKGCLDKWFHNKHTTCPLCRSIE